GRGGAEEAPSRTDRHRREEEGPADEERGQRVADLPGSRARTADEDGTPVGDGDGAHATAPERRSNRAATPRAAMPTSTVSTKSTTPRPMSAERCTPLASPNCSTIALAIVSPGPNRCSDVLCDAPMTSAT